MNATFHFKKSLSEKTFGDLCRSALRKKLLLAGILFSFVVVASFAQKKSALLSTSDSCHMQPPQQTLFALNATGISPMVRVAYVIPSNRTPQSNGVANLQNAIKLGQQFFKDQMEQYGFGAKTFIFETEGDGVTPLIHVVHVSETDEYLRGDLWGRTQQAASNAGISLWAPGEVWVVIPETHVMFPDGSGAGGVALGGGAGSGDGGGVSMIGSNALPLFNPAMITDDTPYDGKVLPELGPYPMKQDVTFAWFEGTTFSSVASSWLGALWHETGHAFGLAHDFRNDSNFRGNLMGNGLRGTRGTLFPEKYPQDHTRLEYVAALLLNVSHFFNRDKTGTCCPTVSATNPASVTPQQGLVNISFQASDPDGLSVAYLIEVNEGDLAGEMLLDGTTVDATFAVPYFRPGDTNPYNIFVLDKQGHKAGAGVQFNVPAGYNQAPHPHIRITPPVPGLNQSIALDASFSWDAEHDLSSILATWDINNDGEYDTEPSTNKIVPYTYVNPGNYLVRLKMTDPAGGETISTPVSIKIPGEPKITVESFTLMDADNDEVVRKLEDGLIIKQTDWEDKTFSVRANTSAGMIDRVEFNLEGPIVHQQIDRESPYALFGDSPPGNFAGEELLPGEYTLTATPFISSTENGTALTVTFTVKERSVVTSDKTIGGSGFDRLVGVVAATDGGYVLAGSSDSNASGDKSENSSGGFDYWVVKIDAQYNKVWDKTFGGPNSEELTAIVSTNDGGYLLGGHGEKRPNVFGLGNYWIVKIDGNGNMVWEKTFGGSGADLLFSLIAVPGGGYLLGGRSESAADGDKTENNKGSADYWIVRVDDEGNKIWDRTFGGAGYDELMSVSLAPDGFLLSGSSSSDISGDKTENSRGDGDDRDYWAVKIDPNGNKIWDKTFGGDAGDRHLGTIAAPDGGHLLTGFSDSNASGDKSEDNAGGRAAWVVKIDEAGNKEWDRTLGGQSFQSVTGGVAASDGGYLLAGTNDTDFWPLRIDNYGNKVWEGAIGGDGGDYLTAILDKQGGRYQLAGYSSSGISGDKSESSKGGYDYWIVGLQLPAPPPMTSFTLINAHTDQEIKALNDGDVIRLTETGTSLLDIRADITASNITKVVFELNGPVTHHQTERQSPYALFGNNQNDFNGRKLLPGAYTLKVIHYINDQEQAAVIVSFTVTSGVTFTLMNAHTDQEIKELKDGEEIHLAETGRLLDVRANITANDITKVIFELNGPVTHHQTERQSPYALFGNQQNNFNGRKLLTGAYTLKVTPFIHDKEATAHTVSFTVTDGFGISSFTLVDATLDKPVRTLADGDIIDLSLFDHHKLAVRADTEPMNIDKVDLTLQGPVAFSNTERVYPYVLFGDITQNGSTDYNGAKLFPGNYTMTATPYVGGHRGSALSINFEVIRNGASVRQKVEVYPIPASGVVNIRHEGITGNAYIKLIDVYGNVLVNRPLSSQPLEQMDISSFRKGIHYLKITTTEGVQVVRLVIE